MEEQFARTELLLGREGIGRLKRARVAIFGLGGVGGYTAEALARSGIGELDLIDDDRICESNINRQIIALHSTVGRRKTEVMRERVLDINPEATVHIYNCFFLPENADSFPFEQYDYIVDAVDTVTAKLELVLRAQAAGSPIISCMGTGNKLDPGRLRAADIYETKICPLARVMRSELKKRGVKRLRVIYSEEPPVTLRAPSGGISPCGTAYNQGDGAPAAAGFGHTDGIRKEQQENCAECREAGEMRQKNCAECQETGEMQQKNCAECREAGEMRQKNCAECREAGEMQQKNCAECREAGEMRQRDGGTGEIRQKAVRRSTPGSTAFVPPAAGLMIAAEVVRGLLGDGDVL